jgi:uncharacterized protein (UPF0335 family)
MVKLAYLTSPEPGKYCLMIQPAGNQEPFQFEIEDFHLANIERVERLEEEKKGIASDITDIYSEAKGNGYDVKALRTIVRLRKQDVHEREEQEAILETYMHAMGMV